MAFSSFFFIFLHLWHFLVFGWTFCFWLLLCLTPKQILEFHSLKFLTPQDFSSTKIVNPVNFDPLKILNFFNLAPIKFWHPKNLDNWKIWASVFFILDILISIENVEPWILNTWMFTTHWNCCTSKFLKFVWTSEHFDPQTILINRNFFLLRTFSISLVEPLYTGPVQQDAWLLNNIKY